ncbi:MAG: RNA polymerase sigma factor [Lacunisphaera sp.]
MIPSDADLIVRVLVDDDRAALGELVRRHQSAVRNFLRHLTRNDTALADDLAQDTFLQAFQGLARFRGGASFSTWLLGIAHNLHRNARRKQREHAPLSEADEASVPAGDRASDLKIDFTAAMNQLSNEERLALHLGYEQGLSHGDIAALLDWPLGTVKTHLTRSKNKLRQLLAVWNPQI